MAEDLEMKLSRLAKETERVGPRAGFSQRVFAALDAEAAPSFGAAVVRFGRGMLAVAALSAVVGVTIGVVTQRAADEAVAMATGVEDLDW